MWSPALGYADWLRVPDLLKELSLGCELSVSNLHLPLQGTLQENRFRVCTMQVLKEKKLFEAGVKPAPLKRNRLRICHDTCIAMTERQPKRSLWTTHNSRQVAYYGSSSIPLFGHQKAIKDGEATSGSISFQHCGGDYMHRWWGICLWLRVLTVGFIRLASP